MALSIVPRPEGGSEADLVASCVAGDPAAQRALFRREYDRVNAMVYRLVGSTRDCDDLVQETFIATFRGLHRFRGDSKLSTWIARIAVRIVFQHLRTSRGRGLVPLELVGEPASPGSVDGAAGARDGLRRLYDALAELAPDMRVAYALYAIDGRTIPEAAQIMGTTAIAAKLRIWRARKRLYARLADDPVLGELVRTAGGEE